MGGSTVTSYSLFSNCESNDEYDSMGKLITKKPKNFLIYVYNRYSADKYLMIDFADRAEGYLAYVGTNFTNMRQARQTSGALKLYLKPGE